MRRPRPTAASLLVPWWAALSVAACGTASPPPAGVTVKPTPTASATAAPAQPPPQKERSFACGPKRCTLGAEACCHSGETHACVPRPDGEGEAHRLALVKACAEAKAPTDEPYECSASADCSGGKVCCLQETAFVDSSSLGVVMCSERSACVAAEVCSKEGAPCADFTAVCIEGACRRPTSMQCGNETCSVDKPYCCVNDELAPQACGTAKSCAAAGHVAQACLQSNDCAQGNHCQRPGTAPQAGCVARLDTANMVLMCQVADDCRALCPKGKPVCEKGASCACE